MNKFSCLTRKEIKDKKKAKPVVGPKQQLALDLEEDIKVKDEVSLKEYIQRAMTPSEKARRVHCFDVWVHKPPELDPKHDCDNIEPKYGVDKSPLI